MPDRSKLTLTGKRRRTDEDEDVDNYLIFYSKHYGGVIPSYVVTNNIAMVVVSRRVCNIQDGDDYLIQFCSKYCGGIIPSDVPVVMNDIAMLVVSRYVCNIQDVDDYLMFCFKYCGGIIPSDVVMNDIAMLVVSRHICNIQDVNNYLIFCSKYCGGIIPSDVVTCMNDIAMLVVSRHICNIQDVDNYLIFCSKHCGEVIPSDVVTNDIAMLVCSIQDIDLYLVFHTKQCWHCPHVNAVEYRYDDSLYKLTRIFADIREIAGRKHYVRTCDIRECVDDDGARKVDETRNENISTHLTKDVCYLVVESDNSDSVECDGQCSSGMSPNDMEMAIRSYAELTDLCGNDSVVLNDGSAWLMNNIDSKTRKACFRLVGSHWVVLGVDPRHKQIFFFDSMGQEPQKYGINLQHEYSLIFSKHVFQSARSKSCGNFCLAFALWLSERPKDIPVVFNEFGENLGFGDDVFMNEDTVKRFML